jgi:glycosyltransferase involved in cell wall biosynthesis
MKKIILSHFKFSEDFSNGVINYSKAMVSILGGDYEIIANNELIPQDEFRYKVLNKITKSYLSDDIIIEAAESQATSLYIPKDYNVHIRMHCPFHLYKRVIKQKTDEKRYSEEVRALYKAKAISSPSYGMLEYLKDDLDIENIHVFKNPIEKEFNSIDFKDKDIDVIFLLRFNRLKGSEYINPILRMLPDNYNVKLIGKQEESFTLDSRVKCNVEILSHIEGDEKYELLQRSKVSLSLSKFENCSMVILESLSSGTPVVCWNVGGSDEIASYPVINSIQYEDVFNFSERIIELVNYIDYPSVFDFKNAIELINNDFISGVKHIENYFNGSVNYIYKGMSCKSENDNKLNIPYELLNFSWCDLENNPVHICLLISSEETYKIVSDFLIKNNISATLVTSFKKDSAEENDLLNIINLNWFINRGKLIDLLKINRVDMVFYEAVSFSSYNKEYDFLSNMKLPVSSLFYCGVDDVVYFNREGSSYSSYIKQRLIKESMYTSLPIKQEIDNNNIMVVCDKITSLEISKLLRLKNNLELIGITFCFIDTRLDVLPSDLSDFYIKENCSLDSFGHIILLSETGINKYIDKDKALYSFSDSIYDNKDIIIRINDNNLELADEIYINNEHRKSVIEFINTKSISESLDYKWFFDEVYAVVNRFSFRESGRA